MDKRKRASFGQGANKKLKGENTKPEPYKPPPLYPDVKIPSLPKKNKDSISMSKLYSTYLNKPSPYYLDNDNFATNNSNNPHTWDFLRNAKNGFPAQMIKTILEPERKRKVKTNFLNEIDNIYDHQMNALKQKDQQVIKKKLLTEEEKEEEDDEEKEKDEEEDIEEEDDDDDYERFNQSDDDDADNDDDEPLL
eukprot:TRINITY_DN2847_c0_g1_i1.p1 TRINITY_DN2847_c0_g1~~TRINITY_DN2847_c0_g1_i1.p1  ORF type:complete len:193 (+),score=75.05 TRINITY_DN2847_c0_g1_i1:2-580(+)